MIAGAVLVTSSQRVLLREPIRFIEDTFEDFADGRLDAGGQNLYVSRDGTIRTIHRFDLNEDGNLDLIFNSTHDFINYVPAAVARVDAHGAVRQSALPVEGSSRAIVEDLNRDGRLDVVFCPNDSGLQHTRRFLTIFWGADDGWTNRRSTGQLPVQGATTIVAADLNGDAWIDIVALNGPAWLPGQPAGRIVRAFWGSPNGFALDRFSDVGIAGAIDLASGDFTGDGRRDVAALTSDGQIHLVVSGPRDDLASAPTVIPLPGSDVTCLVAADLDHDGNVDLVAGTRREVVYVVDGRPRGAWAAPRSVPAFTATQIAAGDLDGDGRADLVLMNSEAAGGAAPGSIHLLWGDSSGFDRQRADRLDVPYAAATAMGDMNGDGLVDIAVAVNQNDTTYSAESVILLGVGGRRFERLSTGVRTDGARWVAVAPPDGAIPARAVFCNSLAGTAGEFVPVLVYWGGRAGFDPGNRWEIPFRSGYEASAADLNSDGHPDLVVLNSQHSGAGADDPTAGANIYWGSAAGFNETNRTVLRERLLGSSNVADLNRDGYLDLVLGAFESADKPDLLVIYYGTPNGFDRSRRVELPFGDRTVGCVIADFNRDEWLDIAFVSYADSRVHILWGGQAGFDTSRDSRLYVPAAISDETADLNADGFLDLIVGSYEDRIAAHHDTGVLIFWGGAQGFRQWDAQWLPDSAPIGMAVADFDGDGHLDLFSPHYLGELTREALPSYLYWGAPDGFSTRRRTIVMTDSAHDALAGDFDHDGRLDLAVSCHTRDGDHHTASMVFYNDGARFQNPRIERLPTIGTHWMWDQDMGHIYHRRFEQTYESSVFTWQGAAGMGRLIGTAATPNGASLEFDIRSAPDTDGLRAERWRRATTAGFSIAPGDRALQYRVIFRSDNGDRYASLDKVVIELPSP